VAAKVSKNLAEVQKKYFSTVKFSTQMLKTLCKTGGEAKLTRRSSTLYCGLHNICATGRAEREFFVTSKHRAAAKRVVWHEVEAKENILRKYSRYS